MKTILSYLKEKSYFLCGALLLFINQWCFATPGDDPFPKINVGNGNVVQATGQQMESGMKYSMVGGGIIMILVGIGVIMHRLREDTSNKDGGSFITTLIMAGVAITVGIILIAIGWGAADYTPPSS